MLLGKKRRQKKLIEALAGQEPPAMSAGVMELMKLMRDPDVEMSAIGEALSWQPDLVVKLLKTVNSAAFGLARPVESARHAATILGRARLEQLVLGVAVKDQLPAKSAPGFESKRFWHSAFFRAALSRGLAEYLHPADEATSFTGGLLQDMAIPLLANARPKDYGPVLEEWHGVPEARLHDLEKEVLGFSHDEIGGHLASAWELPPRLGEQIQAHHDVSVSTVLPALRLVSLHRETESEFGIEAIVSDAKEEYGIAPDTTAELVAQSRVQADELVELF